MVLREHDAEIELAAGGTWWLMTERIEADQKRLISSTAYSITPWKNMAMTTATAVLGQRFGFVTPPCFNPPVGAGTRWVPCMLAPFEHCDGPAICGGWTVCKRTKR